MSNPTPGDWATGHLAEQLLRKITGDDPAPKTFTAADMTDEMRNAYALVGAILRNVARGALQDGATPLEAVVVVAGVYGELARGSGGK